MKPIHSIELFAGAGGLGIGLHNSGFNTKAVIEYDTNACETLRENALFGLKCEVIEADINDFSFEAFSNVHLISGGPPCQPFSLGGKHKAHNDNRDLFPQAVRAVRELKPKAFIFENVKGLLRKSFSSYFAYILLQLQYPLLTSKPNEQWEQHLSRLEKHHTNNKKSVLEYNVTFRLLNAANYGVPQKRERVVIVGFRSDCNVNWSFPEPTHSEDSLFWHQWITEKYWQNHNIKQPQTTPTIQKKIKTIEKKYGCFPPTEKAWQTVRDAIFDLPIPDRNECAHFYNHVFKGGARIYSGHTGSYIDSPSKTLKAGDHGVPGGENMIRYEDGSVRYFTVRESARIQTFPDNYIFEGAWGETMRQLGNAVPVLLSETIGRSIYNALIKK